MKIERVSTGMVEVALEPFSAGGHLAGGKLRVETMPFVVVRVFTDAGIEGLGYAPSISHRLVRTLAAAASELSEVMVGEDPLAVEQMQVNVRRAAWGWVGGAITIAVCAIDIALWDIAGKAAGMPLHKLLGGYRDRIPAYASGFLRRDRTIDELQERAHRLVTQGFRAMKMETAGERYPQREVERLKAVREAVGEDIDIMADANAGWTASQAISTGHMLEEYRLTWLEDPVQFQDMQASARVADALDVPVTAGEYHYGVAPFRDLLKAGAVDILMPDLRRLGGITPWRKVAAMSEAFNVPVVSHLVPEISCQLLAAIPNGMTVEMMPWSMPLFKNPPPLVDGQLVPSAAPGHGLEMEAKFLDQIPG
jgi:L-alanine-DL-glutamate epimerase-like enolase superfamily enzyme